MDAKAIEDLLYRRSGLLGVSGISSDMRALRQSKAATASETIALFSYRIVREFLGRGRRWPGWFRLYRGNRRK